ncbi:MAG: phosphopantetheine-binding protein [Rhizobiaceae bacterium]
MSTNTSEHVMAVVVDTIRKTIGEDWIEDFDIGPQTRFSEDLEIESIEFVKMADALQAHFGKGVDLVGWLSNKPIHDLIQLNVGDIADHIAGHLRAN